ncbi:acetoacetyl-CoA synthetase [Trichonephila clavipes]|nr:acetoacetyl-CoA synthetase [Trichonephila clavipes]
MRISHKRLTIRKTTFAVLLPTYGHKCWKKSSKIGRPDWTTSEPAVAVLCQKSYFKWCWCQNDMCYVNPVTNGILLRGRSDDVLIQKGERFGAADIYLAIHNVEEIQDYICVGQKKWNGDSRAVLFVKMRNGCSFTPEFKDTIINKIKKELWEDCVPELILEVQDIPVSNRA